MIHNFTTCYVTHAIIINVLFPVVSLAASDTRIPSFAFRQNGVSQGSLIASIVNGYIGKQQQPILYCTKQKNFFLAEDESHPLGKGHVQLPARISDHDQPGLRVKYAKEVPSFGVSPSGSTRTALKAIYGFDSVKALMKLKEGTEIKAVPFKGYTVYDTEDLLAAYGSDADAADLHKKERKERILGMRKLYGNECVPPTITENNGDARAHHPYVIACQHNRIKLSKAFIDTVSAFEVHRRVNKFFNQLYGAK